MSEFYPFCKEINLHVKGRIPPEDALRQVKTSKEILRRFLDQPGVILADEVGMGKTFVALAVAVSVVLGENKRRPVVVMVPPSLKKKWPTDFKLFKEKCLPPSIAKHIKEGCAENGVEFLKLLDDPPERQRQILFVTHGAMSRGLTDGWVKLALIYQALKNRWGADKIRRSLSRVMGSLLHMKWVDYQHGSEVWYGLLNCHPANWLKVLAKWGIDPENDDDPETNDDPVPEAVWKILPDLDTTAVYDALNKIPQRWSKNMNQRLKVARQAITQELKSVWEECVMKLDVRLPLLVLDEAHHLKNSKTRLASLFHLTEAKDDMEVVSKGCLTGVFERMLFLTATPFQLGHGELCSVLERFSSVAWKGERSPSCGKKGYQQQLDELRKSLDSAQEVAVTLDTVWGRLTQSDLIIGDLSYESVELWWPLARKENVSLTDTAQTALSYYCKCYDRMRHAEKLLRPWVIRHLKSRQLPEPYDSISRRNRLIGNKILDESPQLSQDSEGIVGIGIKGPHLLPFLLAARATSHAPDSRPVFAEGLASSYEAFLHTRRSSNDLYDLDEDEFNNQVVDDESSWYLNQLEKLIPKSDWQASISHPKIEATVKRTIETWAQGEKVVVFCHYIATGKTLRQCISFALDQHIRKIALQKLNGTAEDPFIELDRIGRRFFDKDSPLRQACDNQVREMLKDYSFLSGYVQELQEVFRRYVRTPSFLVRFFPLESITSNRLTSDMMIAAMEKRDQSGLTLEILLRRFFEFLVSHCGQEERKRYIEAVTGVQTGTHYGLGVTEVSPKEDQDDEYRDTLLPNIRLINGSTKSETRQRYMLAFNTPFYPEIMVCSSVMAEGVDLHLNCRHVIHHDLCWNPSTLEQRTGRIDRIGSKAEQCGRSIHVYLPYIAETQDEKMYRVVTDRERWFNVVMGERYTINARSTEKLANRISLPISAAAELGFRLEVQDTF